MTTAGPNLTPQREPTSSLTFEDLILEVAREIGVAFYGEDGDEEAQIPVDRHDLAECKRHVNNGLRMFFADAPPSGWRFARPVMEITLWGPVGLNTANLSTATQDGDKTIVDVAQDTFFPSMELKAMTVTTVGTVLITKYISARRVLVNSNGVLWTAQTFSIAIDGNYTMPKFFAGMVTGAITYVTQSDQGVPIAWTNEAIIRQWRENVTDETGDPYRAAVRIMAVDGLGNPVKRRWELMVYPKPAESVVVEFPFELHFDKMEDIQEVPPVPFLHDETLKSACLAVVERDQYDKPGRHWENYHGKALPASHQLDARSAPRRLGYFGNPSNRMPQSIQDFRQKFYDRPTVDVQGQL